MLNPFQDNILDPVASRRHETTSIDTREIRLREMAKYPLTSQFTDLYMTSLLSVFILFRYRLFYRG